MNKLFVLMHTSVAAFSEAKMQTPTHQSIKQATPLAIYCTGVIGCASIYMFR